MDISKLPSPGVDFELRDPLSGFKRKFSEITIDNDYTRIHHSVEMIVDVIDPYEEFIKRGGINHQQKWHIWEKIKSANHELTHHDMELIMKILNHLSR